MSPDVLDDKAVCEILINQAIDELVDEIAPRSKRDASLYAPWGGIFARRNDPVPYLGKSPIESLVQK